MLAKYLQPGDVLIMTDYETNKRIILFDIVLSVEHDTFNFHSTVTYWRLIGEAKFVDEPTIYQYRQNFNEIVNSNFSIYRAGIEVG